MHHHDLALIGLGPNNLAIAYQLLPYHINTVIIDPKADFSWHKDAPRGELQISLAKASLTADKDDPLYLPYFACTHFNVAMDKIDQARLPHTLYRVYLQTAYNQIKQQSHVTFQWQHEAASILPFPDQIVIDTKHSDSGKWSNSIKAKTLSLGLGAKPKVRDGFYPTTHYQTQIQKLDQNSKDQQILVLGGGQSAADTVLDLCTSHPQTHIDWCLRHATPRISDENPLVNDHYTFNGAMNFYHRSRDDKQDLLQHLHGTNHGVVSNKTLQDILPYHASNRVHLIEKYDFKKNYALKFAAIGAEDPQERLMQLLNEKHGLNLTADFRLAGQSIYLPGGLHNTHGPTAGTICDVGARTAVVAKGIAECLGL